MQWITVARNYGFQGAWNFDKTGILIKMEPAVPELKWFLAIPNGGKRGDGRIQAKRGAEMKAEGMKAGVADLCWPIARGGYHGLWIEMKTPKGQVSPKQSEFLSFVNEQGYLASVCRGWIDAARLIESYYSG